MFAVLTSLVFSGQEHREPLTTHEAHAGKRTRHLVFPFRSSAVLQLAAVCLLAVD